MTSKVRFSKTGLCLAAGECLNVFIYFVFCLVLLVEHNNLKKSHILSFIKTQKPKFLIVSIVFVHVIKVNGDQNKICTERPFKERLH